MKGIKSATKGFTLLELLVVVLIIGILANIALPQYRKSVVKSKFAEVDLAVSAAKQNIRIYLDANGWPGKGEVVSFTGSTSEGSIDLPGDCDSEYDCETELASYAAYCVRNYCGIDIMLKFLNDDGDLTLQMAPDHEIWFLTNAHSKETCQWVKERNYPAEGYAVTVCSKLGVTLEEYEAE